MGFRTKEEKWKEKEELRKKQREQIILRFKENTRHSGPSNSMNPEQGNDAEKEKKRRKQLQKQLQILTRRFEKQKKHLNELKIDANEYKRLIHSLKHEKWKQQKELSVTVASLKEALKKRDTLLKQEQEQQERAEQRIRELEKESSKKKKKIGDKQLQLANQVKLLKKSNETLRHQIENYDSLTKQEYGNLKEIISKKELELQKYRAIEANTSKNPLFLMKYLKTQMTDEFVPDLLEVLEQFITAKNLKHFFRGGHNVFYLYMRRVGLFGYRTKRRAERFRINNPKYSSENERLGYLGREGEDLLFIDMTNVESPMTYPVANISRETTFAVDSPARAIFKNGQVTIKEFFTWDEPVQWGRTQNKQRSQEQKEYTQFGNFKVLIIGSRYLNEYRSRLEKHGCKVEVHNPYEESFQLLTGKINRSEIILICERHVPHSVWPYVDRAQPFVSVLKKDSQNLIATYAYLTLQRCELI